MGFRKKEQRIKVNVSLEKNKKKAVSDCWVKVAKGDEMNREFS